MSLTNKKALLLSHQGFFFVDKRFEISNLLNGIYDIIELSEILTGAIQGM